MKKITYTPDAADKLRTLNRVLLLQYGSKKSKHIMSQITSAIRDLAVFEQKGMSVENVLGIPTDYRYIFVSRQYVFYRIEEECIRIVNLYHEREDFMWALFGIDTTPTETIQYWKE